VVAWLRAAPLGLLLFTPVVGCSSNGDLTPATGHYDVGMPQSPADAAPNPTPDAALPDAPPVDAAQPDRAPSDSTPGEGGAPDGVAEYIPCDVEAVLKAKCHVCHTDPPQMDAPRPLLTYQNIAPVRNLMEMYLKNNFMPYTPPGASGPPNGPLSAAQKATLLDWLAMGGLPSTVKCP
jgi:hypothetical protein